MGEFWLLLEVYLRVTRHLKGGWAKASRFGGLAVDFHAFQESEQFVV